ncbi:hypothetical protein M413DRAFT_390867 [Hebeloma cylindrosporum]|uniref:Uncharacterized protein n=1 Tax=Hebeloma cylindrosporum TaxID=76867 RepID=A0A0C3BU17_HEBCY|nr:hypothetical protein M413DRAFT_390867 [Hebeloma cylindrosporum h7]
MDLSMRLPSSDNLLIVSRRYTAWPFPTLWASRKGTIPEFLTTITAAIRRDAFHSTDVHLYTGTLVYAAIDVGQGQEKIAKRTCMAPVVFSYETQA